jgi:hypothetical protein
MMKMLHNIFNNKLYSKISSFSNVPWNSSNYSYNFASISISYTKLEKGLQPIIGSLGQFLFTKMNLLSYPIISIY